MAKADLTAARLRELLHYDPETGIFTWLVRRGMASAGSVAGCKVNSGYIQIYVDGVQHKAHRLAWLYVHGSFPEKDLKRKNGIRDDNRIDNFYAPGEKPPKPVYAPLTAGRLRELVDYNPLTGVFTRRQVIGKVGVVGEVIGHANRQGRIEVSVEGKIYLAHRLAWLHVTGQWPKHEIDHKDGNPANNVFENLRDVTGRENKMNIRNARSNSITGILGVRKHHNKWQAIITVDGEIIFLGSYGTPEQAHQAYVDAKRAMHPTCTI